jgi:hypothetical protein
METCHHGGSVSVAMVMVSVPWKQSAHVLVNLPRR